MTRVTYPSKQDVTAVSLWPQPDGQSIATTVRLLKEKPDQNEDQNEVKASRTEMLTTFLQKKPKYADAVLVRATGAFDSGCLVVCLFDVLLFVCDFVHVCVLLLPTQVDACQDVPYLLQVIANVGHELFSVGVVSKLYLYACSQRS